MFHDGGKKKMMLRPTQARIGTASYREKFGGPVQIGPMGQKASGATAQAFTCYVALSILTEV